MNDEDEFMELINGFIEILLHLDKHLDLIIRNYGMWTYAIFFFIIFLETGFVVTPFLPGDSLLFYEKYGGKTIILARFIPIIRTFAPFVAGIGTMTYSRFIIYNITGGIAWVVFFVFGGYFFGNIPFVKNNFSLVIFAIILISVLPALIEFVRTRKKS